MNGSTPGFPVSQSVLKLMSVESVIQPSNHVILCHPLLLLPSIFPSIRVISNELACHIRWSKYWGFSFSISPSSEYSVLIFFRMDWFDLVAVQNSTVFSSITIQNHQFFGTQPCLWSKSHIYTWLLGKKNSFVYRALCQQNDVSAFYLLSRFVIAFLLITPI